MAKKITAQQMLSRIYNMTRGMVSPEYVKAEGASRKKNVKRGMAAEGASRKKNVKRGMAKGGKAKR